MRPGTAALLLSIALVACRRQPAASESAQRNGAPVLSTEEKIVRATMQLLASDGKPLCVEPETFGSPLSIWNIATQGKLQQSYDLAWSAPKPFRPPHQPALHELRGAAQAGRHARLAEPEAQRTQLPASVQADLQAKAAMLAPPAVPTHRVGIRQEWIPAGVRLRWWPIGSAPGCDAQYVLSGVKWDAHGAFVAVRVEHWGTVFALAPQGTDWRPIAQWGTWLY